MKTSPNHIPSLLSSLLFILAALFLFGICLSMAVGVLSSILVGRDIQAPQTIFFIAFGFEGLLLLAAAFFSFQKFLQRPAADQEISFPVSGRLLALLAIVAGATILIGYLIRENEVLGWLVLPILTIPAVVLPLAILLRVGTKELPFGTRWQTWSIFGLGMSLTPFILFIVEALLAIVVLFIIVVYIIAQPELTAELQALSQKIMIVGPDSEAAIDLVAPYLTKPAVIVTALIYMAILVPALEEIFKPLGVWLFVHRLQSQAQGFALGALSGAAYALIETLSVSGQTVDWAGLLFTRIGTGLLHITTSALMGGAIVLAWRERRYVRFAETYLLAVLWHGLWNTVAIFFSFSNLAEMFDQGGRLSTLQPALTSGLTVLAIGLFAILVRSSRRLRKAMSPALTAPAIPNENVDASETISQEE